MPCQDEKIHLPCAQSVENLRLIDILISPWVGILIIDLSGDN